MLNIYGVEAYTQAFTPSFFAPIRLALAGDAQAAFPVGEGKGNGLPQRSADWFAINISSGLIIDESGSPKGDPDFLGVSGCCGSGCCSDSGSGSAGSGCCSDSADSDFGSDDSFRIPPKHSLRQKPLFQCSPDFRIYPWDGTEDWLPDPR